MLTTNTSDDSVQENCIEASMNKILPMSSDLNTWTSTFVVTHGDKSIDVSLAAQGYVVGRLDMYRTKVLMYRTMVIMARLTKVRR
jgi:hypothetical protein